MEIWDDPTTMGAMPLVRPRDSSCPVPRSMAEGDATCASTTRPDLGPPAAAEGDAGLDADPAAPTASSSAPDDDDSLTRRGGGDDAAPDVTGHRDARRRAEATTALTSTNANGVDRRVPTPAGAPVASIAWWTSAPASTSVRAVRVRLPSVHWRFARSSHRCAKPILVSTCVSPVPAIAVLLTIPSTRI